MNYINSTNKTMPDFNDGIYIIENELSNETKVIKVGYSQDIESRLGNITKLYIIQVEDKSDGQETVRRVRKHFKTAESIDSWYPKEFLDEILEFIASIYYK